MINKMMKDKSVSPFVKKIFNFDLHLYTHSVNVAKITEHIVSEMDYDPSIAEEIVKGALLHDIGKIFIPEGLLNVPRPLTTNEMNIIKNHPVYGYELVKDFDFSEIVLDIIYQHHETENGKGYPLHATYMSKEAQIVSLADKYEAMTSRRPYKSPMTKANVLAELAGRDCKRIFYGTEIFEHLVTFDNSKLEKAMSERGVS